MHTPGHRIAAGKIRGQRAGAGCVLAVGIVGIVTTADVPDRPSGLLQSMLPTGVVRGPYPRARGPVTTELCCHDGLCSVALLAVWRAFHLALSSGAPLLGRVRVVRVMHRYLVLPHNVRFFWFDDGEVAAAVPADDPDPLRRELDLITRSGPRTASGAGSCLNWYTTTLDPRTHR